MYYNSISSILKILIEFLYTLFYVYYYYLTSFFINNEEENDIVFFCGYGNIPGEKKYWDGDTELMGGSENSLILLAEKLSQYYNVKIYNNCFQNKVIRGVTYINTKYFNYNNSYSNVVFWRIPLPIFLFSYNFKIKNKILWIHDGEPLCKFFEYFMNNDYINNKIINCYDKLDYIISPSKFLYNKINIYNKYKKNKNHVIPNFVTKKNIKRKNNNYKILWHINFNRGLHIILDNWSYIREINKNFELHIYGNKEELYLNQDSYDEINIENIYFHSKIKHKDIIDKISEFSFFIYPAIIRESFSISSWECLVNGCLPIVYDVGALGEIFDYGGILVPPGDFKEIIKNINYFSNNENYKKKINEINSNDFSFISTSNIINQWFIVLESTQNKSESYDKIDLNNDYDIIYNELRLSYKNYNLSKYDSEQNKLKIL